MPVLQMKSDVSNINWVEESQEIQQVYSTEFC